MTVASCETSLITKKNHIDHYNDTTKHLLSLNRLPQCNSSISRSPHVHIQHQLQVSGMSIEAGLVRYVHNEAIRRITETSALRFHWSL
mmetsp:Transcript_1203/g.4269  ORF Transcript_1203/g.4269 Transcript_1203/m.4269 type:complete len:88 (+) Transcript_1203:235-498(+)